MTIERITENGSVTLVLSGELTALTAVQLGASIRTAVTETNSLALDFKDVEYVASAGLRVLLEAKNLMSNKDGKLIVRNVPEVVMQVFEITGFNHILNLE